MNITELEKEKFEILEAFAYGYQNKWEYGGD
jgi:hypothetical protein